MRVFGKQVQVGCTRIRGEGVGVNKGDRCKRGGGCKCTCDAENINASAVGGSDNRGAVKGGR